MGIGFFLIFAAWLFSYTIKAHKDTYIVEAASWSQFLLHYQESFDGATVIRAYRRENEFLDIGNRLLNQITLANQVATGVFGWYSLRIDMLALGLLTTGCAFFIFMRDTVHPVLLGLMLQYLLNLQFYLKSCMTRYGEFDRKMVSIQRLTDLENIPREASGQPGSHRWPRRGKVKFINARLKYRPSTPLVLKDLIFVVEPGMKVSIVGRTGAGKSTIALALARIVELSGGQILTDGEDIARIDLAQVREKITVITEEPALFSGTLRRNLDPLR